MFPTNKQGILETMRPKDMRKKLCMDVNIKRHFVAVIPSYLISKIGYIEKLCCARKGQRIFHDDFKVFVVLTNISFSNLNSKGHYITLIKHFDHFEVFDPMSNHCNLDKHISNFISVNRCAINVVKCQYSFNRNCAWACLFFVALRCLGLSKNVVLSYLRIHRNVENCNVENCNVVMCERTVKYKKKSFCC